MSMNQTGRQTKVPLGLKATPDCKARLAELTEIISGDLGARITLSQAFEIAINEALAKRKAVRLVNGDAGRSDRDLGDDREEC